MKNQQILLTLISALVSSGCCLVENVSPPSGSIIADFGGLLNNTIFMCDVIVNNGSQQITTQWFIENLGGNTGLRALPQDANLFLLTGDQRPSDPSLTFNNHLVLLNLTSNLDDATIYCGTGQNPRQANFSLRIYRAPSLINGLQVTVLEGENLMVDGLEEVPIVFPFPTFQWTRNGVPAVNVSGSVAFGYTAANFYNTSRTAAGNYSLFAENYVINSTGAGMIVIGNDTGGFTLDVLYGPELTEPLSNAFATPQGNNVTLLCGTNLVGNPIPVVQWFSNTGNEISPSNDNFSINNGPNFVSLTIFNATQNDNGTWNCVLTLNASNGTTLQQVERDLSLTILVAPSEPINTTVLSFGATWIAVSWLGPTFQGMPEFTKFLVVAEPTGASDSNRLALIPPQPVNVSVSNDMVYANVTDIFPGEEYRLGVRAVSESSGVQISSDLSALVSVFTHTTAPEVLCFLAPQSENGKVTVTWDYRHTGGLNLTQVAVDYRQEETETFQVLSRDSDSELNKNSLEVQNLTAGYTYIFRISATNNNGSTSVECPSVIHTVGIPQQPSIHNAISPSPGTALLNVSTREAGVNDGGAFEFVIKAEVINGDTSQLFFQEITNYVDSSIISLIISDLLPGTNYQFSVRVQNMFGASEFSGLSVIQIQGLSPGRSTPIAAIAGGVIAGVIIIILVILIIVVIVVFISCRTSYLKKLEKNKFSSEESDMTENNLYKTTRMGKDIIENPQDDNNHYTAIPVPSSSRPQSGVYDGLAPTTPSHTVKQSDNPLYSSTQELRLSATYDTVPSRARSLTPSAVPSLLPNPNTDSTYYAKALVPTGNNNRVSYGLELEFGNCGIPPVHHQTSLSQTADGVHTEL